MKRLGPTSRAWLKGFHILFSVTWLGAATCMVILLFLPRPTNGIEAHATLAALKLIDDWVIIPTAIGTLLTSLLIGWLTPWGFFKWRWVTVKWIITIGLTLLGTFGLGPALNSMEAMAAADPQLVLQNPVFLNDRHFMSVTAGPQLLLLIFMVFISVLKPWKKAPHPK